MQTLAQVGHPVYEVPLGPTIPAYYGLVASRYMHEYGVTEADLAELGGAHAATRAMHPGAQFKEAISVEDVLASKPVAAPLKLLDCCPVSDGGAAFVVSRDPTNELRCAHHRDGTGAHAPARDRGAEPYAVRRGRIDAPRVPARRASR